VLVPVPEQQELKTAREAPESAHQMQLTQEAGQLRGDVQDQASEVLVGRASQPGDLARHSVLGGTGAAHPVLSRVVVEMVACLPRGSRVAEAFLEGKEERGEQRLREAASHLGVVQRGMGAHQEMEVLQVLQAALGWAAQRLQLAAPRRFVVRRTRWGHRPRSRQERQAQAYSNLHQT